LSLSAVRLREGRGLTPIPRPGLATIYLEDEVRSLDAQRRNVKTPGESFTGETAGAVFDLLAEGKNVIEIVRELRVVPQVVGDLEVQFARYGGTLTLTSADLDVLCSRLALLPRDRITSGRDLVTTIRGALESGLAPCATRDCGGPAEFCAKCARQMLPARAKENGSPKSAPSAEEVRLTEQEEAERQGQKYARWEAELATEAAGKRGAGVSSTVTKSGATSPTAAEERVAAPAAQVTSVRDAAATPGPEQIEHLAAIVGMPADLLAEMVETGIVSARDLATENLLISKLAELIATRKGPVAPSR
jgi:hypothetical protein